MVLGRLALKQQGVEANRESVSALFHELTERLRTAAERSVILQGERDAALHDRDAVLERVTKAVKAHETARDTQLSRLTDVINAKKRKIRQLMQAIRTHAVIQIDGKTYNATQADPLSFEYACVFCGRQRDRSLKLFIGRGRSQEGAGSSSSSLPSKRPAEDAGESSRKRTRLADDHHHQGDSSAPINSSSSSASSSSTRNAPLPIAQLQLPAATGDGAIPLLTVRRYPHVAHLFLRFVFLH